METVSIKQAKNEFTQLARKAEGGETITVTRNGQPVCDIVPHRKKRGINWEAGEKFLRERGITDPFPCVAPDFDEPVPEDFLLKPLPKRKRKLPR